MYRSHRDERKGMNSQLCKQDLVLVGCPAIPIYQGLRPNLVTSLLKLVSQPQVYPYRSV
jgi:hypothetical protein